MSFVVLPHQLFDVKFITKLQKDKTLHNNVNIFIWEHPHYFTTYKYNKKKILLHKASMIYYYEYLKRYNFNCIYVKYNEKLPTIDYILFDPIDKIKLPYKFTIIESPNFLMNKEIYELHRKKTDKFFFNGFYMWGKKYLGIIPNIKSQDKKNRNKLPKDIKIPKIPSNKSDKTYINKVSKFVDDNFANNYGNTKNFMFPVSHKIAKRFLSNFIKKKLHNFGDYQDAIDKNNNTLFHSILSTSLNIGLLNPNDVVNEVLKQKAPMNSKEGFIRQLFWREYQRYCYIYINYKNLNYFGNMKKLTSQWYTGNVGIKPVDVSIQNAFETGYLHHIERLMVIGNYMNLSGISPKEGFKWFMEFSCDSYEWVMYQNVLDMVFFVSGGKTMTRPYLSSSNYILKMSNYSREEWCDIWDKKYKEFINNNKKKLHKYRYYYK